jgi:hypothetical protein
LLTTLVLIGAVFWWKTESEVAGKVRKLGGEAEEMWRVPVRNSGERTKSFGDYQW